jgi:hypothetical protein
MSTWPSNVYYLVIGLPGDAWRTTKDFFENFLRKWWCSHYQ